MRPSLLLSGALVVLAGAACRKAPEPRPAPAVLVDQAAMQPPSRDPAGPPVPVDVPSLAPLVDRVLPTVVTVEQAAGPAFATDDDDEDAQALPDGHPPVPGGFQRRERAGAGVLVGARGLVLTSFHLVRDAPGMLVHLTDGRSYQADLVGRDSPTDLALLRMRGAPANLPVARFGDSRRLVAGDWVLVVGNPFGLSSSVSLGIVSALERRLGGPYDDFLQTDAAINPGSSGGPLFDLRGQLVGIATMVPVAAGIGFAIPSSLVLELLPYLEREGGVTRGALGALFQDMPPALGRALGVQSGQGALLSAFTPDSAAERAGLRPDDVVVALDGRPVASRSDLVRTVALLRPASTVTLTLVRGGKPQDVQVILGTRTDLEGTGPLLRPVPDDRGSPVAAALGLEVDDLSQELARRLRIDGPGAVVVGVKPGSTADVAGLVPGLVITELGGARVRNAVDATAALKTARSGRIVLVRVLAPGGLPHLLALEVP